jgi:hypothetical protein
MTKHNAADIVRELATSMGLTMDELLELSRSLHDENVTELPDGSAISTIVWPKEMAAKVTAIAAERGQSRSEWLEEFQVALKHFGIQRRSLKPK